MPKPKKPRASLLNLPVEITDIDADRITPPPIDRADLMTCFKIVTNQMDADIGESELQAGDKKFSATLQHKKQLVLDSHLSNFCGTGDLIAVNYLIETLKISPVGAVIEGLDGQPPLYSACNGGQPEVVQYLLSLPNMTANVINRFNRSLLSAVIGSEQETDAYLAVLRILKRHITDPKLINLRDFEGVTPTHAACSNGQLKLIKILVEDFNADLNTRSEQISLQKTPFLAACHSMNFDLIKYLVESKRIDEKSLARDKSIAFFMACAKNKLEMARYITTICPAVRIENTAYGSPLIITSMNKCWDIVSYLLTEKPLVLDKENLSVAACHISSPKTPGYIQDLLAPLAKDYKINLRMRLFSENMQHGQAVTLPYAQSVLEMSSRIAKVHDQKKLENIELQSALEQKQKTRKQNLLIEERRQTQAAEKAALYAANRPKSKEDVLSKLKEAVLSGELSALVTAIGYFKEFNLIQSQLPSASAGSTNTVDINTPNDEGDTLLHMACRMPVFNKLTISTLIINGAEVLSLNKLGETPFFVACKEGPMALVTYFLDHRYNYIDTPNYEGKSPADISLENKAIDPIRYRLKSIELTIKMQQTAQIEASARSAADLAAVPFESESTDSDWINIEKSIRTQISSMTISQLKEYFHELSADGTAKKPKKMRRIDLLLLEQRALNLLESPCSDVDTAELALILIHFFMHEEHIVPNDRLINLWAQQAIAAMRKGIDCLTTLSYFISVFASSGKKPSDEFKKLWMENITTAKENVFSPAIARSIRSCAKLFALVDSGMIIPERLIYLVNDPAREFNSKQMHALRNSHVTYPIFREQPLLRSPSPIPTTSLLQQDVYDTMNKHPETLENGYTILPEKFIDELSTPVDIFIDRGPAMKKLIVQVDGPSHFNYEGNYTSNTLFNTKLLEKLDYEVIRISYTEWDKLQNESSKTAFVTALFKPKCVPIFPKNLAFLGNSHPCAEPQASSESDERFCINGIFL